MSRYREWVIVLALCGMAGSVFGAEEGRAALEKIGRPATAAELRAWDIDVRSDLAGLPDGKGDVALGEQVWESKCASCHGIFGESNEVFTPLVGGTTADDIKRGRVENLAGSGYPHRTTLMKLSHVSVLWDYINRAMPWDRPKSLAADEVYGVVAYLLNLGDIVPADFTLSRESMPEVQKRLPNRDGKLFFRPMWEVGGKGDVDNPLCMTDCPVDLTKVEELPVEARNTHGNIAEQVRPFGPARGTDTTRPPRTAPVGSGEPPAAPIAVAAAPATAASGVASPATGAAELVKSQACTACHGLDKKIVGPGFREIGRKYAGKADAAEYLKGKILKGGQGVWGPVPMPAQAQLREEDAATIATWLARGAE